ncbi:pyruvate,water dikinase [Desulfobaculum xiamenense]|uniref:Phosphoenolpyruvate synthase n=1 Tax=Desulfobaculum xiamenense TaxID=995050 RepID=A0A846QLK2_9BACT|nr:PEP/pyruvate-binding domain-containing protein [Desulfobaculum xiamenense]NJB68067.1 pyruvate,water dikinase [Desulfobaculum xiamenense]
MAGKRLTDRLRAFFGGAQEPDQAEVERMLNAHRQRCLHFSQLLAANNRALGIMAEIEEALEGRRPFGMDFVRSRCTRCGSEVYAIIRDLMALAPGRHDALPDAFGRVSAEIGACIAPARHAVSGPFVVSMHAIDTTLIDEVGGKMATLGEIGRRLSLPVPDGFAVTASAFRAFMDHNDLREEIERRIQAAGATELSELYALSSSLRQLVVASELPPRLEADIAEHVRAMVDEYGEGLRLAVRSSAIGEDAAGATFAGQFHTELNVAPEDVADVYREIVAATYGVTGMSYRATRGIRDEDVPMCVGVLRMIDAQASGVAYTADPLSGRRDRVAVHSVWGLPKGVVDGTADADVLHVARGDHDAPARLVSAHIADKSTRIETDRNEGIRKTPVPLELRTSASLCDAEAIRLSNMALRIEEHFGTPQDVEWALSAEDGLIILQARALSAPGEDHVPGSLPQPPPHARPLLAGGVTASPGAGAGMAFVVRRDADALDFPRGAVLVAAQSLPCWAALLPSASAVVTEHGGAAGHLANVAREFDVPAIMGLSGALSALEGAGTVTVDADSRTIYAGRVDALLAPRRRPKNLMIGSPVHATLERAARHIVPLTLRDPSSPDFRPQSCETLHDITRYCHEKSVDDMFARSADTPFPAMCSKRLVCDVPMQYWVVNLDDGFANEPEGDTVRLADIASRPMLALWRGMTAVPWAGPPAVDTRGFLSVLAGAASTPGLDPATRSDFSARNYFLISGGYVNLQSRYGFHFSTVEAAIAEDDAGNYASLHFKGGGADLPRRVLRARLVAEVLEGHGFRTEVRQDALFARIEGFSAPETERCLAVLGYLIVHTRQLDMIMADATAAARERSRIKTDLLTVVLDASDASDMPEEPAEHLATGDETAFAK